MLLPENIEETLGFDKIRAALSTLCQGAWGKQLVATMSCTSDYPSILAALDRTAELMQALSTNEFPAATYPDLRPALEQARIENSYLSPEVFLQLGQILTLISRLIEFFKRPDAGYVLWKEEARQIELPRSLVATIQQIVDPDGTIKDGASPDLAQIRKAYTREQRRLKKSMDDFLLQAQKQGFTAEDSSLTIREGRLVIPIFAEHKKRIKGLIHDASATGKTVYLEPTPVLEMNNTIRELQLQEQREIIKILTGLTDQVRPFVNDLAEAFDWLARIDFTRAKATWAEQMGASVPSLHPEPLIHWKTAKHPLLIQAHLSQGKPVVPLDLDLSPQQRVLVISGPNAGGKSVCLKTVGLLQMMVQAGIPVTADESSRAGVFEHLLVDIGDQQSIENDLSTYSSHLGQMRSFLDLANQKTLFLIDEFGAGTDPQFGGALASAILAGLHAKGSCGMVTTHYRDLKSLAQELPGVVNAAMRFDLKRLEPLYQLEVGKPGSSFALEIAQKIGLPKEVLDKARVQLGVDQVALSELLAALELEKEEHQSLIKKLKVRNLALEKDQNELTALRSELKEQKSAILNQAKEEAQALLKEANQRIEATIRAIKEKKADQNITQKVRQDLDQFRKNIKPKARKVQANFSVQSGPLKIGDWIRLRGTETIGEILKLQEKSAEVLFGSIKSNIKLNRLDKISNSKSLKKPKSSPRKGLDIHRLAVAFKSELDIRGKRAEEALTLLDKTMDQAILVGCDQIRIIHGKGDGILKELVRVHLSKDPHVRDLSEAHPDQGGSGVTLVKLQ